jgi:hypothetical protein
VAREAGSARQFVGLLVILCQSSDFTKSSHLSERI